MAKFDGSKAGPGRPKGLPNKLGSLARENIARVFEEMGGVDSMVAWARRHRDPFYTRVYPRLLPTEAHVTTTETPQRVEEMTDAELEECIRRLQEEIKKADKEAEIEAAAERARAERASTPRRSRRPSRRPRAD